MHKQTKVLSLIIALLIFSNGFFVVEYLEMDNKMNKMSVSLGEVEINDKVLFFSKLFIKEVLQSDGEVSFESRVDLENAVRETEDEEIMSKWKEFTNSKTAPEAQVIVKDLLSILIGKI